MATAVLQLNLIDRHQARLSTWATAGQTHMWSDAQALVRLPGFELPLPFTGLGNFLYSSVHHLYLKIEANDNILFLGIFYGLNKNKTKQCK